MKAGDRSSQVIHSAVLGCLLGEMGRFLPPQATKADISKNEGLHRARAARGFSLIRQARSWVNSLHNFNDLL